MHKPSLDYALQDTPLKLFFVPTAYIVGNDAAAGYSMAGRQFC